MTPQTFNNNNAGDRLCPNCGAAVKPGGRGLGRLYCSSACQLKLNARNKARGAVLAPYVLAHAIGRHAKPGTIDAEAATLARRELARIARLFINEDKRAGRPAPAAHLLALHEGGRTYMDRTRKPTEAL